MSTSFEPRTLVNGGMLRQCANQNISIMLRVKHETGSSLTGTSTDNQEIIVNLPDVSGASEGNWIEIIGVPTGSNTIRGREAVLFGGDETDFDKDGYNVMVHFMKSCKDFFRQG